MGNFVQLLVHHSEVSRYDPELEDDEATSVLSPPVITCISARTKYLNICVDCALKYSCYPKVHAY